MVQKQLSYTAALAQTCDLYCRYRHDHGSSGATFLGASGGRYAQVLWHVIPSTSEMRWPTILQIFFYRWTTMLLNTRFMRSPLAGKTASSLAQKGTDKLTFWTAEESSFYESYRHFASRW